MVSRTDRMGALGHSQGRRFVLHPPVVAFANHYGTQIKACQARDAKRKGKVERPNRVLKESFLEEMSLDPPADVAELNRLGSRIVAVSGDRFALSTTFRAIAAATAPR